MKVWDKLKSLFETPPPPIPLSREQLEGRLAKVREHIKENKRESEIGSRHSSRNSYDNIIRLREEERQIQALLDSSP